MNPDWDPDDVCESDTDKELSRCFDDEELEVSCLDLCIDGTEVAALRRYRQLSRWTIVS